MPRWPESRGLSLDDMRRMEHAVIVAERAGFPLSHFATVTPARHILPGDRPRLIGDVRRRLVQAVRRQEHPSIALWLREAKLDDACDAGEHAHGLTWLPIPAKAALRALLGEAEIRRTGGGWRADNRDANVELKENKGRDGIMSRLAYMQKGRCGQAEGYLKLNKRRRYPWERQAPIIGSRWSLTKDLQALVDAEALAPRRTHHVVALPAQDEPAKFPEQYARAHVAPVLRVVENALVPEPLQLALFAEKPVSRLANYSHGVISAAVAQEVRWRLKRLGLTQEQLAASIGLSRPQLTNALQGRFGLAVWPAARLREYLLNRKPIYRVLELRAA